MAKRKNFSETEIKDICDLYLNKTPRSHIAKKYECTDKVIVRVLEQANIEIKKLNSVALTKNRKFNINDNYFNIDKQSHNSAYILGMLASDGCVASSQNQIYIELHRHDRELLEKINAELKNDRPVKDYTNHSKNYENSKIYFFSKQIKQDLALYNIIPNKTHHNLDFLQNIDKQYQLDFIRGMFDGDGCIKWSNGSIAWQIDSTSFITLQHIQKILEEQKIKTTVCKKDDLSIVNLPVYRIYCYGFEKCYSIYKLFYGNKNNIHMLRKFMLFKNLLLKYKTHETPNLLNED